MISEPGIRLTRRVTKGGDLCPFILPRPLLSMLAAIQAPVIMMGQTRQGKQDRLRSELDFDVNRRAHAEIQGLAQRINLLHDKVDDVDEALRQPRNHPQKPG